MVSYERTHKFCRRCDGPTMHYRTATNHLLHFLITVVTCGWWAIVWLLMAIKIGGWKCEECGKKAGMPAVAGIVVAVGAGMTMLMLMAAVSGPRSRRPTASSAPELQSQQDQEQSSPVAYDSYTDQDASTEPAAETAKPSVDEKPSEPVEAPAEQKTETPEPEYPVYKASQIYAYYDENEIRGDAQLKGKWFAVTGKISDINKDLFGAPFVAFRSNDWIFGVQCVFPRSAESSLTDLVPGNVVTIAGRCDGKMMNVIMSDCRFYDPPVVEQPGERGQAASADEPKETRREAPKWERVTRTWTDSSGKFTIDAEYGGYAMGKVKLIKADGSTISLPFERLSENDQNWINDRIGR